MWTLVLPVCCDLALSWIHQSWSANQPRLLDNNIILHPWICLCPQALLTLFMTHWLTLAPFSITMVTRCRDRMSYFPFLFHFYIDFYSVWLFLFVVFFSCSRLYKFMFNIILATNTELKSVFSIICDEFTKQHLQLCVITYILMCWAILEHILNVLSLRYTIYRITEEL